MKRRELIKEIESNGFVFDRKSGSHAQYKHYSTGRLVTVPVHARSEVPPSFIGLIRSQMRKAKG